METRANMNVPSPAATGPATGSYVDWAAITGGAVVALALGLLFSGFGAALGLTAISAEEGEASSGLVGVIISAVWIVLSMIAAYATGGYIAGRMRRRLDAASAEEVQVRDGMNGLIVWAVGTVLSAIVVTSTISGAISAAGSIAATGVEAAGSAVGGAVAGVASAVAPEADNVMDYASETLLRPATIPPGTGDAAGDASAVSGILANVVTTGEVSDADRAYLVQLAAARTGLPPAEVNQRVDEAIATAQATREEAARLAAEAEKVARDAAETARVGAILTAFLITAAALVAGAASYVCAVRGGRHRDEGRVFGGFAYRG